LRAGLPLIVGFGSRLVADDGAGPAVVEALRAGGVPAAVRVEEGGQDALRIAGLWRGEPEIWLIDALERGAPAGTIHRVPHEELLAIPQRHATAHWLSLPESLRWLAHGYPELRGVEYRLWGIEPLRLELKEGLSEPVREAVARLCAELLGELERVE